MTPHVLVLCTHNSARSVLAEGMLQHHAARLGLDVQAHSAGSAPGGRINPLALALAVLRSARMLQLLALPLATLDRAALQAALEAIGRS